MDVNLLVRELRETQELTRQLEKHIYNFSPDFSMALLQSIHAGLNRAISMAGSFPNGDDRHHFAAAGHGRRSNSRKRKTLPRRRELIRVLPGTKMDSLPDDGFQWRKYGQKEIYRSSHPRGYYRCIHKRTQGCLATKQVQKSDEDPTLYIMIYDGEHTCHERIVSAPLQETEQGSGFFVGSASRISVGPQELAGTQSLSSTPVSFSPSLVNFSEAREGAFMAEEGLRGGHPEGPTESETGDFPLTGDDGILTMDFGLFQNSDFDISDLPIEVTWNSAMFDSYGVTTS
ncbi:transcription factor WRKY19-like [Wolffia australiana]